MKIMYVITKSNWGGAQKYVYDLATHMRDSGHEVSVAFGGYGILAEKLWEARINTIEIANLERNVSIVKEFKVFRNIFNILQKENPDIVHLNSSKIGALGSFIARLLGIKKIIFTAHGFPFREERNFLQILAIKFISWFSILFSHKTICVSQKDFDDVKDWLFVKGKLKMIHNGIYTNIHIPPRLGDCREVKIVSIGELHKNKGFEYALRSINELKEKGKDFKYTILSLGGDERSELERLIQNLNLDNYVNLHVTKESHNDLLKNFDIYFMPSIKEGLPYVLLEAGIYSLPIVASDTGGIREIVENYKNGFLIKPKDINGFELALEKLINDKSLRTELGSNAKKKIIEEFNIEKMFKETEEVYL